MVCCICIVWFVRDNHHAARYTYTISIWSIPNSRLCVSFAYGCGGGLFLHAYRCSARISFPLSNVSHLSPSPMPCRTKCGMLSFPACAIMNGNIYALSVLWRVTECCSQCPVQQLSHLPLQLLAVPAAKSRNCSYWGSWYMLAWLHPPTHSLCTHAACLCQVASVQ